MGAEAATAAAAAMAAPWMPGVPPAPPSQAPSLRPVADEGGWTFEARAGVVSPSPCHHEGPGTSPAVGGAPWPGTRVVEEPPGVPDPRPTPRPAPDGVLVRDLALGLAPTPPIPSPQTNKHTHATSTKR
jgi:hypothetical protein